MIQFLKYIMVFGLLLITLYCSQPKQIAGLHYSVPFVENIVVDGDLSDWPENKLYIPVYADKFGNMLDNNDFQPAFALGWSDSGLFVLCNVVDDTAWENNNINALWAGDCIELFMADKIGSEDFIQVIIAPGRTEQYPDIRFRKIDHRSSALKSGKFGFEAASKTHSTGYTIEAFFPFSNLKINPSQNKEIAFQIYLTDFDAQNDKDKSVAPWFYQTGTYENSNAMQRIHLEKRHSNNPYYAPTIRAAVVDEHDLAVNVFADLVLLNKSVSIYSGDTVLFKGNLLPRDGLAVQHFKTNNRDFSKSQDTIRVYVDDQLEAQFDLWTVPFLYEDLKAHPFSTDIRKFEYEDIKNPPEQNAVLFIGSSSIRMWKTVYEDMKPLKVINRGFGGSQAEHVLFYMDRIVFPYNPSKIVFYEGDNDIAAGKKAEKVLENFMTFVDTVHKRLPETKIYFISIKPSYARIKIWPEMNRANKLIEKFCLKNSFTEFIDVSNPMFESGGKLREDIFLTDQLHMNGTGYAIWTKIIKPKLVTGESQ